MENIKKRLPTTCPCCDSALSIGKMACKACGTEVTGNYALPGFALLSEKEQKFIIDFVKASGSLKDMANNMGVSYPTVRNLLDELIEKLN